MGVIDLEKDGVLTWFEYDEHAENLDYVHEKTKGEVDIQIGVVFVWVWKNLQGETDVRYKLTDDITSFHNMISE